MRPDSCLDGLEVIFLLGSLLYSGLRLFHVAYQALTTNMSFLLTSLFYCDLPSHRAHLRNR
jgi:hypothetical protein